jgi:hypothetical protein
MYNISSTNPQERCNLEHYTYNLRDTEVVICIILVLLKRVDSLNNHLNAFVLDSIQGHLRT